MRRACSMNVATRSAATSAPQGRSFTTVALQSSAVNRLRKQSEAGR
jgi:hypothetical protein